MASTQRSTDDEVAEANPGVCSVLRAVEEIGAKWRLIVLHDLQDGEGGGTEKRFNELKRSTNASSRTLSRVLDDLAEADLVERRVEDRPLATYYRLSEKGRALRPVFAEIERWTEAWHEA